MKDEKPTKNRERSTPYEDRYSSQTIPLWREFIIHPSSFILPPSSVSVVSSERAGEHVLNARRGFFAFSHFRQQLHNGPVPAPHFLGELGYRLLLAPVFP